MFLCGRAFSIVPSVELKKNIKKIENYIAVPRMKECCSYDALGLFPKVN